MCRLEWNSPAQEIFLPLSPYHLLRTQVGANSRNAGQSLPESQAQFIQMLIAQHATSEIFSPSPAAVVAFHRPRIVHRAAYISEQEH
jgi:hypothetical protein